MNGFHVSQVLCQSALSSARGAQGSQNIQRLASRFPPCSFLHLLQCAWYRLPFLFVPWYEKGWEELEAFQLSLFSPQRSPRIWGLLYSCCKVIISGLPFSSLPFFWIRFIVFLDPMFSFFGVYSHIFLKSKRCSETISNVCVGGGGSHITNKQFSDTSWVSYNSTQFWHYLSRDSIRSWRLKAHSHKTAPPHPTSDTHHKLRLSPVLLTDQL